MGGKSREDGELRLTKEAAMAEKDALWIGCSKSSRELSGLTGRQFRPSARAVTSKDCNTLGSEAAATELGCPDSEAFMNALIQAGGNCCCLLLLAVQASINSQLR